MNNELSTAFLLLVVGMITVFTILALVVIGGNLLIRIVNRFPQPAGISHSKKPAIPSGKSTGSLPLSPKTVAVIAAVMETVTQGKGRVEQIEKIDK